MLKRILELMKSGTYLHKYEDAVLLNSLLEEFEKKQNDNAQYFIQLIQEEEITGDDNLSLVLDIIKPRFRRQVSQQIPRLQPKRITFAHIRAVIAFVVIIAFVVALILSVIFKN